ncbi:hypothetical protein C6Y62_11615 [Hyphomicrobium sulfonivorans]|nr:hypothetical protein [Hyphomicrobium sulfonivorans]
MRIVDGAPCYESVLLATTKEWICLWLFVEAFEVALSIFNGGANETILANSMNVYRRSKTRQPAQQVGVLS